MLPEVFHLAADAGGGSAAPSTFWGVLVGTIGLVIVALISHPRSQRSERNSPSEPSKQDKREDALVRDKNKLIEALNEARTDLYKAGCEVPDFPDLES